MHLIDMSNARSNIAYIGETPWHGLGQKLTPGAPLEVWAREAGMVHTIMRAAVQYTAFPTDVLPRSMADRDVLYRSDNGTALSVVSNRYQVVQPSEVLEFFRTLVEAAGGYQLETAGCLDEGRKYWALAKYQQEMAFGNDTVRPYLLLASSADGSMATTAAHTSVRVVCNNTLQMCLSGDGRDALKVSHSTKFDADTVKAKIGVRDAIESFADDVELLINRAISKAQAAEVFVELVAKRDEKGNISNEDNVKKIVGAIMDSLVNGPGARLESARDTAWGALNAVTHYVDFKARARSDENRFSSAQFGLGASLKQKAFAALAA